MTDIPKEPHDIVRRVPIALIATVLMQIAASVWWASAFSTETRTRLDGQARRLDRLETADTRMTEMQQQIVERLARLEEKAGAQLDTLRRIEARLGSRP